MSMSETKRMLVRKEHAADRLLRSQKLSRTSPHLCGEEPPTPTQVSAVLHALADHTLMESLYVAALDLGADRAHLGESFGLASGMGRYFQRMGDWISWKPTPTPPTTRADEESQR